MKDIASKIIKGVMHNENTSLIQNKVRKEK